MNFEQDEIDDRLKAMELRLLNQVARINSVICVLSAVAKRLESDPELRSCVQDALAESSLPQQIGDFSPFPTHTVGLHTTRALLPESMHDLLPWHP